MTQFLRYVVTNGTGRATQVKFEAAGKTGTTDLGRDLLFVGYTPAVVTGVWLGNDDEKPTGASSSVAARVWGDYMRRWVGAQSPAFVPPADFDPALQASLLASQGNNKVAPTTVRASRPSQPWSNLVPVPETTTSPPDTASLPVESTPSVSTEPAPLPMVPAPPQSALTENPDCYNPEIRAKDYRCRNRKN